MPDVDVAGGKRSRGRFSVIFLRWDFVSSGWSGSSLFWTQLRHLHLAASKPKSALLMEAVFWGGFGPSFSLKLSCSRAH